MNWINNIRALICPKSIITNYYQKPEFNTLIKINTAKLQNVKNNVNGP